MPKRPPTKPKSRRDLFHDRLVRTRKTKLNQLIKMNSNSDTPNQFSKLDQMVPTPEAIRVADPGLKSKIIANALAELVNMNGNMQDQIQACQVRIAANNITIKALQDSAAAEGLDLKFTLQGSPESPVAPASTEAPDNVSKFPTESPN